MMFAKFYLQFQSHVNLDTWLRDPTWSFRQLDNSGKHIHYQDLRHILHVSYLWENGHMKYTLLRVIYFLGLFTDGQIVCCPPVVRF